MDYVVFTIQFSFHVPVLDTLRICERWRVADTPLADSRTYRVVVYEFRSDFLRLGSSGIFRALASSLNKTARLARAFSVNSTRGLPLSP
jgi:hypothetical protein